MDNRFYKSVPLRRGRGAVVLVRQRLSRSRPRACGASARARRLVRPAASPSTHDQLAIARPAAQRRASRLGRALPLALVAAPVGGAPASRRGGAARAALRPRPRERRRRASSCASADALQAPPHGEAARQLPIILRAREVARPARPRRRGRRRRRVPARRDRDPRRPADLRPGRRPGPRDRPRRRQPRRQRLQRPRAAAQGRALRGLLSRRRPTASRAPAPAARRRCIEFIDDQRAARHRRHLLELQRRRRPGRAGLDPEGARASASTTRPTKASPAAPCCASTACRSWPSPVLSFPLNDERKSGFLPPSFGLDSRSGFQAAIPYYWNIAPNRDATFTLQREPAPRRRRSTASSATWSPTTPARSTPSCCPTTRSPSARAIRCAPTTRARCRTTCYAQAARACASPTTTTGRISPAS